MNHNYIISNVSAWDKAALFESITFAKITFKLLTKVLVSILYVTKHKLIGLNDTKLSGHAILGIETNRVSFIFY